jgi:DHA1 family inner membrane transport protein
MLAGRIVAALCHGAFFGIGSVVAADLVAENKRASAIAMMFAGLTVANVLGVPLGTLLGQQLGWRSTFWAITVIGVVAMIGIAALVPDIERDDYTGLRGELRAFRHPQVWLSKAITILGYGGMFGAFTYIAFTLTEVSGFASSSVPWLLVLFGVGLLVGNTLGAKAADRALTPALISILTVLTLVLVGFAATAQYKVSAIIALFLMGAFGFATVPGLQMRIMNYAAGAPTLASGANIAAFNVGNALGAWLGGLTIAGGLGFTSPIWMGAVVTVVGLIVLVGATALDRSGGRTSGAGTGTASGTHQPAVSTG